MQRQDPLELNFESLAMQTLNIPTYRAQMSDEMSSDEKNGVICLVFILFSKL